MFLIGIAMLLLLSGCTQNPQSIEVVGKFSAESNACGAYSVTSAAQEKYFADLNANAVKGLEKGDEVKVSGKLIQEQACKKIIVERYGKLTCSRSY